MNTAYEWRQALSGAVIGRPAVQAQSIVTILDGGNIKSFSASGRPLWSFTVPGRLCPYITRSREGTSYVCRTNGNFYAINRAGRELWRIRIGSALSGQVVLGWDGRLFIPAAGKILCYTASGNLLWSRALSDSISVGPWPDQFGGIILALANGDILRINQYGATVVRNLDSAPRILLPFRSGVTANNGPAPLPILVLHHNGDLQAFDFSQTESAVRELPKLPNPPLAAAGKGDKAAIILANGQLIMLSCTDGTILWTGDTHIRVQQQRGNVPDYESAVIFDRRGVFALSASGAAGFDADGRRLWFTTLTNASGVPAFDENGVLFSGGTDWILYAWKLEERSLYQGQSLYGPAPEGVYHTAPVLQAAVNSDAQNQRDLDQIRRGIMAGRVGENEPEWLDKLMKIAGSALRQGSSSNSRSRAQINHRIAALDLLSRIGSGEIITWLARLYKTEDEAPVKAAAARAIGGIGADPNGIALQEFLADANGRLSSGNEQVLIALVTATGALCCFSGPPLSGIGVRILVQLCSSNQPPAVQRQALQELRQMSN